MINSVTNTSILNKSYVARGLIVHQATTHNLIRGTDGTLWAGVRERHLMGQINLYRSTDRGFDWHSVFRGSFPTGLGWGGEETVATTERANGPFISLCLFENLNKIVLWHTFNDGAIKAWPFIFNTETLDRDLDEVPSNSPDYEVDADELCIKFPYNENMIYMCYVSGQTFNVRTFYPNQITLYRTTTATADLNYVSTFDAQARKDGLVDIACANDSEQIKYFRYNDRDQTFTTAVTVAQASDTVADLNIVRDGNGHLLCTWADVGSSSVSAKYSLSTNDGATWTTTTIPTLGTYIDDVTDEPAARITSTSGINGFLITYVDKPASTPRTYVRTLSSGVLGTANEIATLSHPTSPIVGAHFFETPVGKLLDIDDPGLARVGFQVGEGNAHNGLDTMPVRFGQELLSESAYPLADHPVVPAADVPDPTQRLVTLTVLAGPSDNQDFYLAGATSRITNKYIQTFKNIGTPVVILRYDPSQDAETNDRSAYGMPTEFTTHAVVTPMSYEFPFPQGNESVSSYIERDARRLHLPPNFFLEREFVLNTGNYLKRTIWTVLFSGNEYEISQVVPSLVNGSITHYSANAYVVGPSNDPFSRVTLPSET